MRVLWFTGVTPPAIRRELGLLPEEGCAGWVENLQLKLRDHPDVHLAIAGPTSKEMASFYKNGIRYYAIPSLVSNSLPVNIVRAWMQAFAPAPSPSPECLNIIDEFKPDIIHVHGTENPYGLITLSVNVPAVISIQGILNVCARFFFRGVEPRDLPELLLTKKSLAGAGEIHCYNTIKIRGKRELEIFKNNIFFIGHTDWDRHIVELLNKKAVYFHCDEILRSPFYSSQWESGKTQARTIYTTSSNMLYKGGECLIEAYSLLIKSGMNDLSLKIAGVQENSDVHRYYLRKARKFNVESKIVWLGRLCAKDMVNEMVHADVFAYPSHTDNSPNALCEALMLGMPCVATYVGGIPSLVEHGEDCLLCADSDPYDLAGKIKYLLQNTEMAEKMGINARAKALKRHDPDRITNSLVKIYQQIPSLTN